ncbi:hypothetical protein B484DRAFT_409241, partial [Ochromonadaceae sp. CCMP2298]
ASAIFYGSSIKTVQSTVDSEPRYPLDDFQPSDRDRELIPLLEHNLVKRRHSYFGTADELREVAHDVQFVVFDDFDFSTFNVDDIKRLLDREMDTQRCFEDEAVKDKIHIYTVHDRLFPTESNVRKFRVSKSGFVDCAASLSAEQLQDMQRSASM